MIRDRIRQFDGRLERALRRVAGLRGVRAVHRGLSPLPFGRSLVLGLLAGVALGFASLGLGAAGVFGVVALGSLALVVGLTAQPVWVEEVVETEAVESPDLFDMVSLDGGTFLMGSPEDEPGHYHDEELHEVTVSGFRICKTTVTREQYQKIMGVDKAPGAGGPDHPVTEVSWKEAVEFCNRASKRAGFKPCYHIAGNRVTWRDGNGYRLPTEAEWEYAVRAGTRSRWSFGDDESKLGEYAWFSGNSGFQAHPVAQRKPNPWGLFDMHGNVLEWCWDVYGEYPGKAVRDPRGPSESPSVFRVLRGGSAWVGPGLLRSADRGGFEPVDRSESIGFRCLRVPHPQL